MNVQILFLLVVASVPLSSAQELPTPQDKQSANSSSNEPKGAQKSAVEAADTLQSVVDGMQSSLNDFRSQTVSNRTLKTQAEVVSSLDELIRLAKSLESQGKSTSQPSAPKPKPNDRKPANKSDTPNSASQQKSDQRKQTNEPQDSSGPTQGTSGTPEGSGSSRRVLVNEVWGHLPPALRRRLLGVKEEKPIPRYQGLVEQYFRVIAEGRGKRKPSASTRRQQK
jgi:hypothetical protein